VPVTMGRLGRSPEDRDGFLRLSDRRHTRLHAGRGIETLPTGSAGKQAGGGMQEQPFERRRCLVPATGWYEWQDLGKKKRPIHMCAKAEVTGEAARVLDQRHMRPAGQSRCRRGIVWRQL
jgi:SOS response associated peptidase (SRAP)